MAAEDIKAHNAGKAGTLDKVKLVAAALLVAAGVAGYYLLGDADVWLRWVVVVAGLVVSAGLVAWTRYGHELLHFMRAARMELRKVVWPDRQDTLRTTGVVLAFVVIAGVFFWALDVVLTWATHFLTQGG
jgi:preprotein translocase subunit SecE